MSPPQEWLPSLTHFALEAAIKRISAALDDTPSLLLNLGPAKSAAGAALIAPAIAAFPSVTFSAQVGAKPADGKPGSALVPDMHMAAIAAKVICKLSKNTPGGAGNFNFAATFNAPPGIPFFPAGYAPSPGAHRPHVSWAIGLENPDVVLQGLAGTRSDAVPQAATAAAAASACHGMGTSTGAAAATAWKDAAVNLHKVIEDALLAVQLVACDIEESTGVPYNGVDASVAPAVAGPSLVQAYEVLLGERGFGGPGTLAVSRMITGVLAALREAGKVRMTGYCGLMLPPLEDTGLAAAMERKAVTVPDIMMYSSVCGLGLDTVPVPGDTAPGAIMLRMADLAALAYKLDKPLSCRLFPVPGKVAGDRVVFDSPHMVDGVVVAL